MIDEDLPDMTHAQLVTEVMKLRNGIRQHRDAEGHELCWWVPELWLLLPEQKLPDPEVPPKKEFIACCKQYRDSLDVKNRT